MIALVVAGWVGTILYLANHAYLSLVPQWRPRLYYSLNLIAALLLVVCSVPLSSWQSVSINGFWASVSLLLLGGMDMHRVPGDKRWFNLAMGCLMGYVVWSSLQSQELDIAMLGWSSVLAFSGAYLLLSTGKMTVRTYLVWNTYAALALIPQLLADRNWPVIGMEGAWAAVSVWGLLWRRRDGGDTEMVEIKDGMVVAAKVAAKPMGD